MACTYIVLRYIRRVSKASQKGMRTLGLMHGYDGQHWDTAKIRRAREYGWIRQNESLLIEEARRRTTLSERTARNKLAEALRSPLERKCPRCGGPMRAESTEGVDVQRCPVCRGIFFGPGQLEDFLTRHDAQRRGFVRRLLREHRH